MHSVRRLIYTMKQLKMEWNIFFIGKWMVHFFHIPSICCVKLHAYWHTLWIWYYTAMSNNPSLGAVIPDKIIPVCPLSNSSEILWSYTVLSIKVPESCCWWSVLRVPIRVDWRILYYTDMHTRYTMDSHKDTKRPALSWDRSSKLLTPYINAWTLIKRVPSSEHKENMFWHSPNEDWMTK